MRSQTIFFLAGATLAAGGLAAWASVQPTDIVPGPVADAPRAVASNAPPTAPAAVSAADPEPPAEAPRPTSLPGNDVFAAAGRALVVARDGRLSLLEPGSLEPASEHRLAPGFWALEAHDFAPTPVEGDLLLTATRNAIAALEATTFAPRWQLELGDDVAFVKGHARVGDVIVLGVHHKKGPDGDFSSGGEVVGLAAGDGHVLWRRPASVVGGPWAAGTRAYLVNGPAVEAMDIRTGDKLWSHPACASALVAAEGGRVAVACHEQLAILDAATGDELAATSLAPGRVHGELVAADGFVYIQTDPGWGKTAGEERVLRVALATGEVGWSSPMGPSLHRGSVISEGLSVTADAVLACHHDGTVSAFDRATGRQRWRWGAGRCGAPVVFAGGGRAAVYVRAAGDEIVMLPEDPGAEPERAVVTGRVTHWGSEPVAGARVAAFGVETKADQAGRYRLEISGRGRFVVQALGDVEGNDKCDDVASGQTEPVELDGSGSYEVDVDVAPVCSCGL